MQNDNNTGNLEAGIFQLVHLFYSQNGFIDLLSQMITEILYVYPFVSSLVEYAHETRYW